MKKARYSLGFPYSAAVVGVYILRDFSIAYTVVSESCQFNTVTILSSDPIERILIRYFCTEKMLCVLKFWGQSAVVSGENSLD